MPAAADRLRAASLAVGALMQPALNPEAGKPPGTTRTHGAPSVLGARPCSIAAARICRLLSLGPERCDILEPVSESGLEDDFFARYRQPSYAVRRRRPRRRRRLCSLTSVSSWPVSHPHTGVGVPPPIPAYSTTPYHPCKPGSAGVGFVVFGIPLVQQIRGQNAVTPPWGAGWDPWRDEFGRTAGIDRASKSGI